MIKTIQTVEDAGGPGRLSEDRVGVSGNIAWVIDGASDFRNERNLPAVSNVHWLVDRVQDGIRRRGADQTFSTASQLLFELRREIASELAEFSLADMQQHPCCSLALLVVDGDGVEVSRVGDAVGYLRGPVGDVEVSTEFFDTREAAAVAAAGAQNLTLDEIAIAMHERRSEYIHGIAGESVFSGAPRGNLFVHTFLADRSNGFDLVLLSTDGLARAVTEYKMFPDWRSLIDRSLDKGLDSVVEEVRTYERDIEVTGKFKKSDDIAAILLEL